MASYYVRMTSSCGSPRKPNSKCIYLELHVHVCLRINGWFVWISLTGPSRTFYFSFMVGVVFVGSHVHVYWPVLLSTLIYIHYILHYPFWTFDLFPRMIT